jgi:hypothetical protein
MESHICREINNYVYAKKKKTNWMPKSEGSLYSVGGWNRHEDPTDDSHDDHGDNLI